MAGNSIKIGRGKRQPARARYKGENRAAKNKAKKILMQTRFVKDKQAKLVIHGTLRKFRRVSLQRSVLS